MKVTRRMTQKIKTIPIVIQDSQGREVTLRRKVGEAECYAIERYYGESAQAFLQGEYTKSNPLFLVYAYSDDFPYKNWTLVLSGAWDKEEGQVA